MRTRAIFHRFSRPTKVALPFSLLSLWYAAFKAAQRGRGSFPRATNGDSGSRTKSETKNRERESNESGPRGKVTSQGALLLLRTCCRPGSTCLASIVSSLAASRTATNNGSRLIDFYRLSFFSAKAFRAWNFSNRLQEREAWNVDRRWWRRFGNLCKLNEDNCQCKSTRRVDSTMRLTIR